MYLTHSNSVDQDSPTNLLDEKVAVVKAVVVVKAVAEAVAEVEEEVVEEDLR